jgi:hypothetical protein
MSAEDVGKRMVFFIEFKHRTIGSSCICQLDASPGQRVRKAKHTSVGCFSAFLLTISEQKELESIWRIHSFFYFEAIALSKLL